MEMQAWKGPQVAYPSARRQNDKAIASLSGAFLYIGLYTGSVCRQRHLGWMETPGGAAGSVHRCSLLRTEVAWTHLWCLLKVVHFVYIFQLGICRVSPAFLHPKRGLALAQSSQELTTTMCHPQQTTGWTAYSHQDWCLLMTNLLIFWRYHMVAFGR